MEKSIEERATAWAIANTGGVSDECRQAMITSFKIVYETIATEQETIDNERIAELEKEKAALMLELHNKNKRIAELLAR